MKSIIFPVYLIIVFTGLSCSSIRDSHNSYSNSGNNTIKIDKDPCISINNAISIWNNYLIVNSPKPPLSHNEEWLRKLLLNKHSDYAEYEFGGGYRKGLYFRIDDVIEIHAVVNHDGIIEIGPRARRNSLWIKAPGGVNKLLFPPISELK